MDNEAIKAYSSVIADAAEDSEPEKPIMYGEVNYEDASTSVKRADKPPPYNH